MGWLLSIILLFFTHSLSPQAVALEYHQPTHQVNFALSQQQRFEQNLSVALHQYQISNRLSAKDLTFYSNKQLQAYMFAMIANLSLLNNGNKVERIKAFSALAFANHPPQSIAMQQALQKILQAKCNNEGKLVNLDRDNYMTACIYKALKETLPHKVYLEILKLFQDKTSIEILQAETSCTIWGYWLSMFWEKLNRLLNNATKRASCTLSQIKEHPFNKKLKQLIDYIDNKEFLAAQKFSKNDPLFKELFTASCQPFIQKQQQEKQQTLEVRATEQVSLLLDSENAQEAFAIKNPINTAIETNRLEAIHSTLSYPNKKEFILSRQSERLLQHIGLNPTNFKTCEGNQVQQALHKEHLQIIDTSAGIYFIPGQKQHLKNIIEDTIRFVDIARQYNHAGYLQKATSVSDCCWAFLDCAISIVKGIGKGSYKGVKNYVDYAIDHPAETLARPIIGNFMLATQLAKLTVQLVDVAHIGIGTFAGNETAMQEWEQLCNNITAVKNALHKKYQNMSLEECVTEITAFATETMLDYKCAKTLSKFYQTGERKTLELINKLHNNLPPPPLHAVAVTPEGFEIGIANQAAAIATGNQEFVIKKLEQFGGNSLFASSVRTLQNTNDKTQKNKIPDFIQEKRVPKDHETILVDPSFKKTNMFIQNARVYKKNKQYYYRDQLHTGKRAHLEVFNKRGKHLGEADPITGILIPGTCDKNKILKI